MDKIRKLELIERSLGIRHKLRVHESLRAPDTHEDLAIMLLSKWELEDELRAIEEILTDDRNMSVAQKKRKMLGRETGFPRDSRSLLRAKETSNC